MITVEVDYLWETAEEVMTREFGSPINKEVWRITIYGLTMTWDQYLQFSGQKR